MVTTFCTKTVCRQKSKYEQFRRSGARRSTFPGCAQSLSIVPAVVRILPSRTSLSVTPSNQRGRPRGFSAPWTGVQGSTVNQIYYIEELKRVRDTLRRKRPELWRNEPVVVFPSRQRSNSLSTQNSLVLGQTFDHCSSPPHLLSWPCSMWLFLVPTT